MIPSPDVAAALIALVFIAMVALVAARKMPALLALPLAALSVAFGAGVPLAKVATEVVGDGLGRMQGAIVAIILGAALGRLLHVTKVAPAIVRFAAEFAGESPLKLALALTTVAALLFTTLGGLGAVIMVAQIMLPVMISAGIPPLVAGVLLLFALSLGGLFNVVNWQLFLTVLQVPMADVARYATVLGGLFAAMTWIYAYVALRERARLMRHSAIVLVIIAPLTWAAFAYGVDSVLTALSAVKVGLQPLVYSVAVLGAAVGIWRGRQHDEPKPWALSFAAPLLPVLLVMVNDLAVPVAFLISIAFAALVTWSRGQSQRLTRALIEGFQEIAPAALLMLGIGMLLLAVKQPQVTGAIEPWVKSALPSERWSYVLVFLALAPLALYRGPLNLWGMGGGLVAIIQAAAVMPAAAVMAMLMAVGQLQGACDPTNTHNVWIANYLRTDPVVLLKRTLIPVWTVVGLGLLAASWIYFV